MILTFFTTDSLFHENTLPYITVIVWLKTFKKKLKKIKGNRDFYSRDRKFNATKTK